MKYKELEYIKKELEAINYLHKEVDFECYTDGMFSFGFEYERRYHELSVINENATFMKKEKPIDLLELEGTFYFSYNIYPLNEDEEMKTIEFRLVDQPGYVDENLN